MDRKPNFVVLIDDDEDARSMVELPQITKISGLPGTRFASSFVSYGCCDPSRANNFRGQYATHHGLIHNAYPRGGARRYVELGLDHNDLSVWMRNAGYRTGLVGKWLCQYLDASYVPPGWEEWFGEVGVYWRKLASDNGVRVRVPGHSAYRYAKRCEDFIAQSDERPFFLWIGVNAPHAPCEVHPRYADRFSGLAAPRDPNFDAHGECEPEWNAAYPNLTEEQVSQIDEEFRNRLRSMMSVGDLLRRVVKALKAAGKLENTYLVFTSDHGYHMGNHRLPPQKLTPYEEDIRVPLHVRGPGVVAGQIRDEMVLNIDLAPTVCDLAGVETPAWLDGRSYAPLLRGEADSLPWRRSFGIEGWDYATDQPNVPRVPDCRGVRTRSQKLVRYATRETQWFDLTEDPQELSSKPRSDDPAEFDRLVAKTEEIHASSGVACRVTEDS